MVSFNPGSAFSGASGAGIRAGSASRLQASERLRQSESTDDEGIDRTANEDNQTTVHREADSEANVVNFRASARHAGTIATSTSALAQSASTGATSLIRSRDAADSEMLQTILQEVKTRLRHLSDPTDRTQRVRAIQTTLDQYSNEIANLSDDVREGLAARVDEYRNPPLEKIVPLALETIPSNLPERDVKIVNEIIGTIDDQISEIPALVDVDLDELSDSERAEIISQNEAAISEIISSVLENNRDLISTMSARGRQFLHSQLASKFRNFINLGNISKMLEKLMKMIDEFFANFEIV